MPYDIIAGLFTPINVKNMVNEIMSLIGVCLNSGAGVAFVMPYMGNGSLLSYLRKDKNALVLPRGSDGETVEQ